MNASPSTPQSEAAVYRKITWHIMPFLFFCYVLAYVDRVNVGFAKLQMQQALGMSDAVYGLGAGIFFIGYFLFEVPANMILQRIGARLWIGPLMMAWGVVSACTLFVQGNASFYALRFLLGIVESGFFPGVILYLTYWYTQKRRARMVAVFMSAVPVSGMVAGPISGWILGTMSGAGHLAAWQWLFLLEGIPSVLVGAATLFFLTDRPSEARWLAEDEKSLVLRGLAEDDAQKRKAGRSGHRLVDAFRSVPVWLLGLAYFGMSAGNYGITFWLPQIIKDTITSNPQTIGWIIGHPVDGQRRRDESLGASLRRHRRKTMAHGPGRIHRCRGSRGQRHSRDSRLGWHCRPGRGGVGSDVSVRGLLGVADRDSLGVRGGRGNRLDQLDRESRRLCESPRRRFHPRSDAQHGHGHARARVCAADDGGDRDGRRQEQDGRAG